MYFNHSNFLNFEGDINIKRARVRVKCLLHKYSLLYLPDENYILKFKHSKSHKLEKNVLICHQTSLANELGWAIVKNRMFIL